MNIEEILELIDDILEDSWTLPLSGGKSVIDADKVRDLINNIRINLPQEIKQSKLIVSDREDILRDAKKEAESIVRRAEERARAMVATEEVTKQSRAKAASITSQAQAKAKEIQGAAGEFSDSILKETEEVLTKSLKDIKTTRQALRTVKLKNS